MKHLTIIFTLLSIAVFGQTNGSAFTPSSDSLHSILEIAVNRTDTLHYFSMDATTVAFEEPSFSVNRMDVEKGTYPSEAIEMEVFVDTTYDAGLLIRHHLFPPEFDEFGSQLLGQKKVAVYKISICNDSSYTRNLSVEDGIFVLVQEALDTNQQWVPVEYFMHSWCGLSYQSVQLAASYCVDGFIVKYEGTHKTKLRVKLLFDKQVVYSNVYDGSVNLGQFYRPAKKPSGSF